MHPEILRSPHRPGHWRRFALRGVKSAAVGVAIALGLSLISKQPLPGVLIYSISISLCCWFLIDLGRDLVAQRMPVALLGSGGSGGAWPGWLWMIGIVAVGAILGYAAGNEIGNFITGKNSPGPFSMRSRESLSILVLALAPAMVITYFFQSREVIALQKGEVEAAQRQAAEQQLKLLAAQLEPHMLFNTLANLRVLIGLDPARAQEMLDRLIAFLRASLAGSRTGLHPLSAEFERLRDYLALMQVRMGARLASRFELPPELADAPVPPLLMQPLVENSIKHGLEPHVAGGRIEVTAAREGEMLVLRVRDSGAGLATASGQAGDDGAGGHYGLVHVRERLATLYGERGSFTLASADDGEGGTLATLRLPLDRPSPSGSQPSEPRPTAP